MRDQELDRILNDALASYTAREPRVGFSARIIAKVEAESPKQQWNWLSFATAAIALISLAATVTMWRNEPPAPVRAHVTDRVPVVPAIRKVESPQVIQRPPVRDRLTREQRALLVFAQQAPEAARQLSRPYTPLEIEKLSIQPLQINGIEIGEIE